MAVITYPCPNISWNILVCAYYADMIVAQFCSHESHISNNPFAEHCLPLTPAGVTFTLFACRNTNIPWKYLIKLPPWIFIGIFVTFVDEHIQWLPSTRKNLFWKITGLRSIKYSILPDWWMDVNRCWIGAWFIWLRLNGRHFASDILKCISLNEKSNFFDSNFISSQESNHQ